MKTIIDIHTHIFPDELAPRAIAKLLENSPNDRNYTDGTVAGLIHSMQQNSVTRAVTLPIATKKEQVPIINQQQAAADRRYIIPFGTIHPETESIDTEIDFLKEHNIPGIKLHPEYQHFYLDDEKYYPLYDALSSAGLAVVFHAGRDPGPFSCDHAMPDAFKKIRKNFPLLRMVAAHMGGWKIWEQVAHELAGEHMFFDTSAVYGILKKELFMQIAKKHGTENLLFGSDSPWFDHGTAIQWIDSLPLTDVEKEHIFSTNAQRLLSLSLHQDA